MHISLSRDNSRSSENKMERLGVLASILAQVRRNLAQAIRNLAQARPILAQTSKFSLKLDPRLKKTKFFIFAFRRFIYLFLYSFTYKLCKLLFYVYLIENFFN